MMRRLTVAVLVSVGLSLTGCGQKGDLYLPDEEPSSRAERLLA